jgi:DNA polymerase III subunit epsilon
MKTLFYDTETTGFVQKDWPPDHPSQPHLVQLGVVLADEQGKELASAELIVRPEGYSIPKQASDVHGITTEMAVACGVPLMTALSVFCQLRSIADEMVAYNAPFDELVMAAAIARSGRQPSHPGPAKRTCAMTMATPIVALPPTAKMIAAGFDKHKPPNLTEAHKFFFGEGFSGAHGALTDTRACMRVFNEIKKREVV